MRSAAAQITRCARTRLARAKHTHASKHMGKANAPSLTGPYNITRARRGTHTRKRKVHAQARTKLHLRMHARMHRRASAHTHAKPCARNVKRCALSRPAPPRPADMALAANR